MGKLSSVALAAAVLVAVGLLNLPVAGAWATMDRVDWGPAYRSGRLVGEILVNGHVVIRVRQAMGGLDAVERAAIVAGRLEEALSAGLRPGDISVGVRTGGPSVELPTGHLVLVGQETAAINRSTPQQLARVWADQLRVALGGEPLPDYVSAMASWYGPGFDGRLTASGEVFDQTQLTAAHPSLPFGTLLRVTNPNTGASVEVRINDRGPFIDGRDIDLSRRAAELLGILRAGVARVLIEVIDH